MYTGYQMSCPLFNKVVHTLDNLKRHLRQKMTVVLLGREGKQAPALFIIEFHPQ